MLEQLPDHESPRYGDPMSMGYSLGSALTRAAFSNGYGMSLDWDRDGMMLRLRF